MCGASIFASASRAGNAFMFSATALLFLRRLVSLVGLGLQDVHHRKAGVGVVSGLCSFSRKPGGFTVIIDAGE